MGPGRAGRRRRVRGALDTAQLGAEDPLEPRSHKGKCSHVGWLFLHPDELARVLVSAQDLADIILREGIHLSEGYDCRCGESELLALHAQLMGDLAGA